MGTLEKDKECALSRDCFEGIWNARGRLEAASARIEKLGIAGNKTKQGNRNSVAANWTRTVPVLFPLHQLSSSRLDSEENCPFPFAPYFTWLAALEKSLLQESYGHLVEFRDEQEAAGEKSSVTDDCFIFTRMEAIYQQLDTAACTLNRAAEFWRRSKQAKDTKTYTRLLQGHSEELCEMASIFNQANLVVESATKQGTSQCTKFKARAAEAGRELGDLNRLHQRIVLGQQAQAESGDMMAGESQAMVPKDGLDVHPQAPVKRGGFHTVQQKAQVGPGETKAGGDEAMVATTQFEDQSQPESKVEELEEQLQALVRTVKAHTIQQKARWVLKEHWAEETKANVGLNQLEEEQSQIEVKATADLPLRMPSGAYWVAGFFDIVVFQLLMHVPIFYDIVAVLLIIHLATKLWDLL